MDSVVHDVLSGKSRMALAITEPDAGSDVRGLQTEATLSDDGKALIVNGQKKVMTCPILCHTELYLAPSAQPD